MPKLNLAVHLLLGGCPGCAASVIGAVSICHADSRVLLKGDGINVINNMKEHLCLYAKILQQV